jgi:hypothetical protein
VRDGSGKIILQSQVSGSNVINVVRKRSDILSMPSIISSSRIVQPVEPVTAEDTVKKLGGEGAGGAYSEHLFSLEELAERSVPLLPPPSQYH